MVGAVKNTDENAYGEHCWTFRHPKFRADHLDGLEDIKRKSAPARRSTGRSIQVSQSKSPTDPSSSKDVVVSETAVVSDLQSQIDGLLQTQHDLKAHIMTLETNYRSVLDEMAAFQRGMASQDALIQNLLQHLINYEQPRSGDPALGKPLGTLETNFVSEEAQRLMSTANYNPEDVARASLQQLTELSRRANRLPVTPQPQTSVTVSSTAGATSHPDAIRSDTHPRIQTSDTGVPGSATLTSPSTAGPSQSPLDWSNHKGLQVLTVGHLLPRTNQSSADEMEVEEQVMPSTAYPNRMPSTGTRLRVRRKTYVPGWAVPPRVLLVEDDAVSRKLSSKFLQVLGVTADIAVDGDAAVKQMCLERYDLVLMDIVMPRLDGVAATSLIRQFDHRTPIISMTSNSCPQDILNYYSHGMNDILPKPFTRDGLFSMLEKHLNHLKSIQQLSHIPRSLEDSGRLQEVVETTDSAFQTKEESSVQYPANSAYPINSFTNPGTMTSLSGLGPNEEQQYATMLANMSGDLFADSPGRSINLKRAAPDPAEPESNLEQQHPSKRGRFDSE
ncbi:kinase-regulated stress-responsive transcription factor skn7 [Serendipita sp. 399]|nr:kinase-regulated stress-responsive transcription factor skn7 [Serendipita sp. 399]